MGMEQYLPGAGSLNSFKHALINNTVFSDIIILNFLYIVNARC